MSDVERFTATPGDESSWWADPKDARPTTGPERYDPTTGAKAQDRLGRALTLLNDATDVTDRTLPDAARYMAESIDLAGMAGTVAMVQELRRRLALVEAYMSRQAGQVATELGAPREGALPDGRTYDLRRGRTRKAWDHEAWKRDLRREVVGAITDHVQVTEDLVDVQSGEVVALAALLHDAVATSQEAHGSTAPRVTALKSLGLTPGDYCEETPGSWGIQISAPATSTTTTDSGEPDVTDRSH